MESLTANIYGKCLKTLNTKDSDKVVYGNSAAPDQTALKSSLIRVYTVCHSTNYFKKQMHKMQDLGENSME